MGKVLVIGAGGVATVAIKKNGKESGRFYGHNGGKQNKI